MSTNNSAWNSLRSFGHNLFSSPHVINNDEFMVATYEQDLFSIFKFNTHKHERTRMFSYGTTRATVKSSTRTTAYDNEHKLLYIGTASEMFTFDLLRNKITAKHQHNKSHFKIIFVNNRLHQIDNGVSSGGHYVYDATNQFKKLAHFVPLQVLYRYGLIYIKSKKEILLFGGYDGDFKNTIYRFACVDSKWEVLDVKMPITLASFGLVTTTNERYIIILGGMTTKNAFSDNIFIYDTRNNIFTKSKMTCPTKTTFTAIIVNNSKRDEITTVGFVNYCYKTQKFVGIQLLPHYLMQIICCYFCIEKLHLLDGKTGEHWNINVDHIFQ